MATSVLTAVRLFVDGDDLSTDHYQWNLTATVDAVENTRGGGATATASRSFIPGLKSFNLTHSGYTDSDGSTGPDDVLWADYGAGPQIVTFAPSVGAENDLAFTARRVTASLEPFGGNIGDMAGLQFSGTGSEPDSGLVMGFMLLSPNSALSSSGNTTGLQYSGGVGATEYLYASLHVLATTGSPTLDVIVQSDTSGFGSPTNQITFTQATAKGSQWGTRVAGTIADDYYRVNYTFGGTGDITAAVVVGIQ